MRNLIPHFIYEKFERQCERGDFRAVAMFVDVSGFTHLAEILMRYESDGAEVLADALNRIFAPPVAQVYAHGGFISSFAGDAFTALFPFDPDSCSQVPSPGRNRALWHAVSTAGVIREFFIQHGRLETKYGQFEMGVKIGLSLGEVTWGILGSETRHTYFFRGPAIDACAHAEAQAEAGDVIADGHIWTSIRSAVEAQPLDVVPPYYRLTGSFPHVEDSRAVRRPAPALTRQALAPFVLNAVLDLIAAGAQAEFRQVAAVFISFEVPRSHADLSAFVTMVINTATDYGGYFNKLDFGDKGPVMLVLFGAPVAHENDLNRAADFLLTLKAHMRADLNSHAPLRFRAGLTFGTVYAGLIGATEAAVATGAASATGRCEFTAIGNVVNFACRLMQKADWGQILVSREVAEDPHLAAEHIGNFAYKGFTEPQPTYRLLGLETDAEGFFDQPMVGRRTELAQLTAAAQPIFEGRFAGVAYIYGEPGIGKSHLAYELHQALRARGDVVWFMGHTDQTLRQAFNPFAYFIRRYFNQLPEATPDENKARFEKRLARLIANLQDLSPTDARTREQVEAIVHELTRTQSILGALIGLHWSNSLYASLDAQLRYQNTLFAIKTLLVAESHFHPVVLVIEDLQWLDSASHEAITVLTREIAQSPLFVVVTSRYADDGSKPTLGVAEDVPVMRVDLNVLSPVDLQHLAQIILGGPIDDALLRLLQERTQANPFFAQQFLYYFQENGWLARDPDTDTWSVKADIPDDVPTTINAILIARVDRLEQHVKNVVKGAAVLGREFDDRVLARMLQADVSAEVRAAVQAQIWSEVQ
jgi:class 3 adenylate cyclase